MSESQEACTAAAAVLREYYEGASLIQMGQKTQSETDEQVNNGNPYQRNAAILASFEQQLAEERAKLPAFRAQNAAILAASTNPYSQYYQSLAAPATTQGNVQQQPSIFNPTLSRMQQELDERARRDPWLRF